VNLPSQERNGLDKDKGSSHTQHAQNTHICDDGFLGDSILRCGEIDAARGLHTSGQGTQPLSTLPYIR
jgi:hypothetical protein